MKGLYVLWYCNLDIHNVAQVIQAVSRQQSSEVSGQFMREMHDTFVWYRTVQALKNILML